MVSPSAYTVENPIVVDRDGPLFLHGASRYQTVLRAADPSGSVFSLRALLAGNPSPLRIDLEGVSIERSVVEFAGPGSFVLQGCNVNQLGVQSPILVDHPAADVPVVGGDISNLSAPAEPVGPDHNHAWEKRGRFRIYGTTVEDTAGRADFRIDARSRLGPHMIADVRSEGSSGAAPHERAYASSFLFVLPSGEAVDVLLKNKSAAWGWDDWGRGHVAAYDAAGLPPEAGGSPRAAGPGTTP